MGWRMTRDTKGCITLHMTCRTPTKIIIYYLIEIYFNDRYFVFYLPILFTGGAKMAACPSRCISETDLAQGSFPENLSVCENENLNTFLPIPRSPGLFPGTHLAMAPRYPSDELISTRHSFPFLLSANKKTTR